MSFRDRARHAVLEAAALLERESQRIDVLRSLDATEAARWLRSIVALLRKEAEDYSAVNTKYLGLDSDWLDLPVEQWISYGNDPTHRSPHTVLVGGYVRARLADEDKARNMVEALRKAITG
jgi:hypothetical protein